MTFWLREIAGWALLLVGLWMYFLCIWGLYFPAPPPALPYPKFVEAMFLTVIGTITFRGGVHLLRVAVAARIALQPQQARPLPLQSQPMPTAMK